VWEDNIKEDHAQIMCDDVDWIHLLRVGRNRLRY
jgi:hypothetical protein